MKTKTIIGIALLSLAIAAYLLMRGEPSTAPATTLAVGTENGTASTNVPPSSPATPVPQSNQEETDFSSVLSPQDKALLATGYVLTAEEKEKLLRKKRQKDSVPTMEELKIMMDTPVEFYGQVLDQFDQPVVGAKIRCSWPYMGPPDSPVELLSAAPNGQFEVLGIKAKAIMVFVDPPQGYDEQVRVSKDILIAKAPERILQSADYKKFTPEQREQMAPAQGAAETYKGDKTKPVIFRLKKL